MFIGVGKDGFRPVADIVQARWSTPLRSCCPARRVWSYVGFQGDVRSSRDKGIALHTARCGQVVTSPPDPAIR